MRCPQCRNRIVQKSADSVRIRSHGAITFYPDGSCFAKCFFCKSDVELPLELTKATSEEPEFVVEVVSARRRST